MNRKLEKALDKRIKKACDARIIYEEEVLQYMQRAIKTGYHIVECCLLEDYIDIIKYDLLFKHYVEDAIKKRYRKGIPCVIAIEILDYIEKELHKAFFKRHI